MLRSALVAQLQQVNAELLDCDAMVSKSPALSAQSHESITLSSPSLRSLLDRPGRINLSGFGSLAIVGPISTRQGFSEVELDPDADPPKLLFIGPGLSGDLLELIGRELEGGEVLIHHCMKLRPQFFPLLKGYES